MIQGSTNRYIGENKTMVVSQLENVEACTHMSRRYTNHRLSDRQCRKIQNEIKRLLDTLIFNNTKNTVLGNIINNNVIVCIINNIDNNKQLILSCSRWPTQCIGYSSIFLQHYRIHKDIGNSKNYLGIKEQWTLETTNPFVPWQVVCCIQEFDVKDAISLQFVRVVPIAKVRCIQGLVVSRFHCSISNNRNNDVIPMPLVSTCSQQKGRCYVMPASKCLLAPPQILLIWRSQRTEGNLCQNLCYAMYSTPGLSVR